MWKRSIRIFRLRKTEAAWSDLLNRKRDLAAMLQRGSRVTSAPFSCPEGGGHLYPVSNAFLNAVKANTRKYYWISRITTTAGTVYEFDQDGMAQSARIKFRTYV